ncbi:hypothetical protein VTO42DRAFT_1944 [Malbranchea cinnamomea]
MASVRVRSILSSGVGLDKRLEDGAVIIVVHIFSSLSALNGLHCVRELSSEESSMGSSPPSGANLPNRERPRRGLLLWRKLVAGRVAGAPLLFFFFLHEIRSASQTDNFDDSFARRETHPPPWPAQRLNPPAKIKARGKP